MRPLHCSDQKREILYVKDNNEWTKETDDKPILTKAIKTIANQNIKQINRKPLDNYYQIIKQVFITIIRQLLENNLEHMGNH